MLSPVLRNAFIHTVYCTGIKLSRETYKIPEKVALRCLKYFSTILKFASLQRALKCYFVPQLTVRTQTPASLLRKDFALTA